MSESFFELIEKSLDFTILAAGVTPVVHPHTTGWRSAPELIIAAPSDGALVRLELEGGRVLTPPAGSAFYVPSGITHRASLATAGGTSLWAHISYRILGSIDPLSLITPLFIIPAPQGRRIGEICTELTALLAGRSSLLNATRRRALGFELLAIVLSNARPTPVTVLRIQAIQRIAPALSIIETKLSTGGPSVASLAHDCGVSRSRLHVLFHAALGRSPLQHIQASRLRRAQHLLLGSDSAIATVATLSGFGDAFHFSRTFKRLVGENPSSYRLRGLHTKP
jgi:AraC-like DNA-binding protein